MNTNICECCKCEHDGSYGSGRFCSESCKQKFIANRKGKIHICRFCGKEFETSQKLGAHARGCGKNPNARQRIQKQLLKKKNKRELENPIIHVKLICKKCNNEYELNIRKKQFDKNKYSHFCSSKCAHSYASSFQKWTPERRKKCKFIINGVAIIKTPKICEQCGKEFYRGEGNNTSIRFCSKECSDKHRHNALSKLALRRCSNNEFGGKNNDTYKKHKRGWYHGIFCGSSWELAFVIYQLDHGKNVKRSSLKLPYVFNGKIFNYYPDFEIDGIQYEIKGFEDFKAKEKHKQYPQVVYLTRNKLKTVFKYVIQTYGKDFVRFLEKKKSG